MNNFLNESIISIWILVAFVFFMSWIAYRAIKQHKEYKETKAIKEIIANHKKDKNNNE